MAQVPTWSEQIAPIIFTHCTSCHRPGEIAPFSLTKCEEAVAWGGMIAYVTDIRYMPPWKPDPNAMPENVIGYPGATEPNNKRPK